MNAAALLVLLAGCVGPADDVIGPFTGETHRYVVDSFYLPASNQQARELGGDLNGDDFPDNNLGQVMSMLSAEGDSSTHGVDMIAGGAIASSIEIVADELADDATVSVRYLGADTSRSVIVGGTLVDGGFRSNLAATTHVPGAAEIHLPVFMEADPSVVNVIALEVFLVPDGRGGFEASVHGAIPADDNLRRAVHHGISQMIASDPGGHRGLLSLFDTEPFDGELSFAEVVDNTLMQSLLLPDITIGDGMAISLGFRAHLTPCASGHCTDTLPLDRCFDRVLDGDETDVDCGGSCRSCEAGATCAIAEDCETITCEQGHCGPPSCSNGVRDGLESDVDCGGGCGGCALGMRCYFASDCTTGQCGAPCVDDPDNAWDCIDLDFSADTCQ